MTVRSSRAARSQKSLTPSKGVFTFLGFGKKALGALSGRDRRPLVAFLERPRGQKTEKVYSSRRERFPAFGALKITL